MLMLAAQSQEITQRLAEIEKDICVSGTRV